MVDRNVFQPPDAASHHHGFSSEDSNVLTGNWAMSASETPLDFSLSAILHDTIQSVKRKILLIMV
jgi:hypothetical protein